MSFELRRILFWGDAPLTILSLGCFAFGVLMSGRAEAEPWLEWEPENRRFWCC